MDTNDQTTAALTAALRRNRERRAELAKMNLPALRQEYRERVGYPAPRGWNKADLLNYFAV